MESPSVFIPIDRRHSLAAGVELPSRSHGAALFADISGFTLLTEDLARALGSQRGAEELTRTLNLVYDALVATVDQYGGTVIGFSGDALTCWFDDTAAHGLAMDVPQGSGHGARRATACGLAMQTAMTQFAAWPRPTGGTVKLAMKAAVATGPVRRFLVGDPHMQVMDVLAGATLDRLAAAEHLAASGEVVVDANTLTALDGAAEGLTWRTDPDSGEHFARVTSLNMTIPTAPWSPLADDALTEDQIRPWVFAPIYEQARQGLGQFLAELRPCVALFMRFQGLDFESDKAEAQLDGYVRWVQTILARYEGFLMQMTIGDKGSYLYAAFGAPIAHDDDPRRAVAAALELREIPREFGFIEAVQMGVTRGRMRTGPYGGATRRTYGVLGDDVNLAARLMQAAAPGQVLVSERIYDAVKTTFALDPLTAIQVKGKTEPIPIFTLLGRQTRSKAALHASHYTLPMVGRQAERALIAERLSLAAQGRGQIVGITAEAGMGKSRLVAEVVCEAEAQGFQIFAGECQSYGALNSYLVWEPIWQAIFGIDPNASTEAKIDTLAAALTAIAPSLTPRLPLLSVALNIPIPDNDLTRAFDAKLRKSSLEALLVDCLRATAERGKRKAEGAGDDHSFQPTPASQPPYLIVMEDTQWIDPLSHDLLEAIGRTMIDLPLVILLAYRPPDPGRPSNLRVTRLPHFTEVTLMTFSPAEAARLIQHRLETQDQWLDDPALPALVANLQSLIADRAQGNPFFIEEILNYLRDRGIDPRESQALVKLDLPTSLHSLILSRIDQLSESQKITLKVASIIGRQFIFQWLFGAYPQLGAPDRVQADLDAISRLNLVALDQPEPELVYLFKHIVTQEVAYESLLAATRTLLHGHLAEYIELTYQADLHQYLDLLAFHYEHSPYETKKREYLARAGAAAQTAYANTIAIDYYRRLLPLLDTRDETAERCAVLLKLGQVLELVSDWGEAGDLYRQALGLAEALADLRLLAQAQSLIGGLLVRQKRYAEAAPWLEQARASYASLAHPLGVTQTLAEIGEVYRLKGDYPQARVFYSESLQLIDTFEDTPPTQALRAKVLKSSGTLAAQGGAYDQSAAYYSQSLALLRELNDKPGMAAVLNNMGIVARFQGDYAQARARYEESLAILRELGDRWSAGQSLNNLGLVARFMGDNRAARDFLTESVDLQRQLGDPWGIANALSSLGNVLLDQGDYALAADALHESLIINHELGDRRAMAFLLEDFAGLAAGLGQARRALVLAGAAAAIRSEIGTPLSPAEQTRLDTLLAVAHTTVGAGSSSLLAEGQAMPLEQAIEYALERQV